MRICRGTCLTVAEHELHRRRNRDALAKFDPPPAPPHIPIQVDDDEIEYESPRGEVIAYRCGCLTDARESARARFFLCPRHEESAPRILSHPILVHTASPPPKTEVSE